MKELMSELISVLREDSIFALISSAASSLAVFIAILVMIQTTRNNRRFLAEEKKERLINSQKNYPLLSFNLIENNDYVVRGRTVPDKISCSTCKILSNTYYYIAVDNGSLAKDSKPSCHIFFSLCNESDSVIKTVQLLKISVMCPTKLENKYLEYRHREFCTKDTLPMSNSLLLSTKKIMCCLQVFLDTDDYSPFFTKDNIQFMFQVAMETISGLTFYQTIVYDGSDVEYFYSENSGEDFPLTTEGNMMIS